MIATRVADGVTTYRMDDGYKPRVRVDLNSVAPSEALRISQRRAWNRGYYSKNKAVKAEYYLKNKDEYRARSMAWRTANPDRARALGAAWRKSNPEHVAERKREWYDQNRDLCLSRAASDNASLADSVVRKWFVKGTGLSSLDIPDAMVPSLRKKILIKREIKRITNEC